MLDRYLSENEAMIIDYRPIKNMLEEALDQRTNGNNTFSKEVQAEIDHLQSLIDSYDTILEDIESEGGIAPRAADLDEISVEAVRVLVDLEIVTEIDSTDLLEPIPVASIEGDDVDDDEDEEGESDE